VEFKDNIIYLTPGEVDAFCPANTKWARSQIEAYGLARCARSEKLSPLLACTELLKSLGLDYVVMEAEAESVESEVLADAVPADAVPADAVPADAVPADAVPADAVPADAVPEGFCRCSPAGLVGE